MCIFVAPARISTIYRMHSCLMKPSRKSSYPSSTRSMLIYKAKVWSGLPMQCWLALMANPPLPQLWANSSPILRIGWRSRSGTCSKSSLRVRWMEQLETITHITFRIPTRTGFHWISPSCRSIWVWSSIPTQLKFNHMTALRGYLANWLSLTQFWLVCVAMCGNILRRVTWNKKSKHLKSDQARCLIK